MLDDERLTPDEIQRLKDLYPQDLFEQLYMQRREADPEGSEFINKINELNDLNEQKNAEINHLLAQLG